MDLGDSSQQSILTWIFALPYTITVLLWSKPWLGAMVLVALLTGCVVVYCFKQCWVRYRTYKEYTAKIETLLSRERKGKQKNGKRD